MAAPRLFLWPLESTTSPAELAREPFPSSDCRADELDTQFCRRKACFLKEHGLNPEPGLVFGQKHSIYMGSLQGPRD